MKKMILSGFFCFICACCAMAGNNMVCYIFLGNSNMAGRCAKGERAADNVLFFSGEKGFYRPADSLCEKNGSPVIPFLNQMSNAYPSFKFSAIVMASDGIAEDRTRGDYTYEKMIATVKKAKSHAVIGGVLAMYGFSEGEKKEKIERLDSAFLWLLSNVRVASKNSTLPCIFGRYEMSGGDTTSPAFKQYRLYQTDIDSAIIRLPKLDANLQLTPVKPVPREMYCDDHHYTLEGYKLWANDAVKIIQEKKWDSWKK